MKVAIMTLFNGLDSSYSLVNVVKDQITRLLNNNIAVKILVSEQCDLSNLEGVFADKQIEWCPITNSINGKTIKWIDYSVPSVSLHSSFNDEVAVIAKSLLEHLQDVDICFLHDILFQGWHYVHNIAIREVSNHITNLNFISFTHSFPLPRPKNPLPHLLGFYMPLRNTKYVYPTVSGLTPLASQYCVPEGYCHVVSNSFSLMEFCTPEVASLHQKVNLTDCKILVVYPARLTPAKQHNYLMHLVGSIYKNVEPSIKIIFCDFPSMDVDESDYKKTLMSIADSYGMKPEQVIFSSEYGFKNGFPRKSVLDLFTLSNLFICPSYSESFGLTVLEAASRGNYIVLNSLVPALNELSSYIPSHLMSWRAKTFEGEITPNYANDEEYYLKHAHEIVEQMFENPVIQSKTNVRNRYSLEWIWKNQLEPLISSF